jgi:hypothetical protein
MTPMQPPHIDMHVGGTAKPAFKDCFQLPYFGKTIEMRACFDKHYYVTSDWLCHDKTMHLVVIFAIFCI